jgi:hypothetical protein
VRLVTALVAWAALAPSAAALPIEKTAWSEHPAAFVLLLAAVVLAVVLAVAALVGLLGVLAPSVQRATDRQARATSPGWTTFTGALVAFGVLLVLAWASSAGETPGALAALALGAPAALLFLAGVVATLPLLGERLLGARGTTASPLLRLLVGAGVVVLALAGSAALRLQALVLAVAVGWPLGTGLGTLIAAVRRPRG